MGKPTKPNKTGIATVNDKVYTEENTAKWIIQHFNPKGLILDPSAGKDVFYNNYPETETKFRCEIEDGVDFFHFREKVDWIITNPPYSIYDKFLEHSFTLSDNVVFFCPIQKAFKSERIERMVMSYGGLKEIVFMGGGRKHKLPFGFAVGCLHYQREYKGDIKLTYNFKT